MFNILVDTCFWIALYNSRGNPKETEEAETIAGLIVDQRIVVPFPTLYEFVSSRLSRREIVLEFEKQLSKPNIEKLPDTKYRDKALENFFAKSNRNFGDISLVDEIIKLIIHDTNIKIDYIASFDKIVINEALSVGIKTF